MKRLKVLLALLAVVFSVANATKPTHKFASSFFSYLGGTNTDPASYVIRSGDPGCSGTKLCAIFVKKGLNNLPDQNALNNLSTESSGFTVAGTFTDGIVEFKR